MENNLPNDQEIPDILADLLKDFGGADCVEGRQNPDISGLDITSEITCCDSSLCNAAIANVMYCTNVLLICILLKVLL